MSKWACFSQVRGAGRLAMALLAVAGLAVALPAQAEWARVIVHFKTPAEPVSVAAAHGGVTAASAQVGSVVPLERRMRRASWLGGRQGLALQDGRVIDAHRQVVYVQGSLTSAQLAERLAQDPAVAWAAPDLVRKPAAFPATAPNDPLYPANNSNDVAAGQWYLRAPDGVFVSAINAQGAWARALGSGVVVADIDTGVLTNHPDLAGQLLSGYDFVSASAYNRDNGGWDNDPSDPGDWTTGGECGSGVKGMASSWHGTQTSSVIAASTNNGLGMAGVAPDARIVPLRVLTSCGGFDSDIQAAMLWAAGLPVGENLAVNPHPARVLNLSLGAPGSCPSSYPSVINDVRAQGAVIVVSAGNQEGLAVNSPANCPGVIAVGGLRHSGTKVSFSSVGPEVAVSAPGGNCVNNGAPCLYTIITARDTSTTSPDQGSYGYATPSNYAIGTSFAAPMVSGVVAMMLEVNPSLTPDQVKSLLQSSARAFPQAVQGVSTVCHAPDGRYQDECLCTTRTCGAGMLDAAAAVQAASPTAAPTVSVSPVGLALTVGGTLVVNGSGSLPPMGRVLQTYAWSVAGGHSLITGPTSGASVTLSGVTEGFDQLTLMVTDNLGVQTSRTFWLAVNAADTPQARIVLPDTTVTAGSTLLADGSTSVVSGGSAAYAWQVLQGNGVASITGASDQVTALLQTALQQYGDVSLALTVDDGQGHQASQVSTFHVVTVHPSASLMAATHTLQIGQSLTLDASLSVATAGRSIVSYQWRLLSGQSAVQLGGSTTTATATLQALAAGSARVAVTVTDDQGAQDTRFVDFTVVAPSASAFLSGQGGGGGGAADLGSLLGLAGLLGLAWWGGRRGDRRGATLS